MLSCCHFQWQEIQRPQFGADTMIVTAPEVRVPRGTLPRRELSRFVREVCETIPLKGAVSILLTTDAAMKALNQEFRRKNKPTDILSFPAENLLVGPAYAGDLAVSIETAATQAVNHGHSLLLEVQILLLHGLLHLSGHDHEQDTGQMLQREQMLRQHFGLPLGLIQRASEAALSASKVAAQ